jgi:VanZ family protein
VTDDGTEDAGSSKTHAARHRRRLVNGAVAVYWMAMFVGTHIPNPEAIIGPEVSDKLLHFVAYFVLMMLLAGRERLLNARWPAIRKLGGCLLLVTVYATLDELLQAVPGINRHADLYDALADVCGACAAAVLAFLGGSLAGRQKPR